MTIGLFFFRVSSSGGAERMICWLANALSERGFQVVLISWDEPDAETFFPLHPAVRWEKLGFRTGVLDKLRRICVLARTLRKYEARALIGFVVSADRTVYAAARLAGSKLIVAERNAPTMYRHRYTAKQRQRIFKMLHLADCITVQMPGFLSGYPASLRARMAAIPNPVPQFNQFAKPESASINGRYTLLAVSRLDEVQKCIDCLLRAFSKATANNPNWDLRIIGDGPDEADIKRIVAEAGMSDRISIEPARTDVFEAYLHAHLFVIPSRWEGFPNALAEALAHGLPAVGFSDAAGVADLIVDGAGWLAPGLDDEASLAKTLELAMADGEERARKGRQAVQHMASFEPSHQFERWVELINKVAGEPIQ